MQQPERLEQDQQDTQRQAPPGLARRDWIEPTFETTTLKETLSTFLGDGLDGPLYYS